MRLFFGLSLPPDVRAAVSAFAASLASDLPARWVLPENYHITLAFLGDVPQERLPEASAILADCAASFPPVLLRLGIADHFGRAENGILILRVLAQPELLPLHDRLTQSLAAAGLPHDPGPFAPHITLARHANVAAHPLPDMPPCSLNFLAQEACVYLSARNESNILRYTPLAHFPFAN